jgi:hypothetical protein
MNFHVPGGLKEIRIVMGGRWGITLVNMRYKDLCGRKGWELS